MDFPMCLHYKELLDVYPNAKVLLTLRDEEKWDASWGRVSETVHNAAHRVHSTHHAQYRAVSGPCCILASLHPCLKADTFCGCCALYTDTGCAKVEQLVWVMDNVVGVAVPPVRSHVMCWLVPLLWGENGIFGHALGEGGSNIAAYRKHVAEVRATVPPERLVEYNVKQGWGPLCEMLDVRIPDEPFPFANAGMSGIWREFVVQTWKQYTWQVLAVVFLLLAATAHLTMQCDNGVRAGAALS